MSGSKYLLLTMMVKLSTPESGPENYLKDVVEELVE